MVGFVCGNRDVADVFLETFGTSGKAERACKRGYLPTPNPFLQRKWLKKIIAETADYFYVLVSRDDAIIYFIGYRPGILKFLKKRRVGRNKWVKKIL